MSFRVGRVAVIAPEPERECELCGKTAECRPYGPKGEQICHDCGMKDPETTERQLNRVLLGRTIQ